MIISTADTRYSGSDSLHRNIKPGSINHGQEKWGMANVNAGGHRFKREGYREGKIAVVLRLWERRWRHINALGTKEKEKGIMKVLRNPT